MDFFQSLSLSKASKNYEQKNHSSKVDGKTYVLPEIRKYEEWITKRDEKGDNLDLYANDSIINTNSEYRQDRFLEPERKISRLTENIANISNKDYSNENASNSTIFDAHFTPLPQGNSHGIWHSSSIRSDPQHVLDDKEKETANYLITSRTSKSENDDTKSDNINTNIRHFVEMFSSTLHDSRSSTSIASNSSEEYRAASNVSNRDAVFGSGRCMPESVDINEKGNLSYPTSFPTSTDVFPQKRRLVSHYRTHTGEKPFACDKCVKKFRYPSKLAEHRRTHTGEKPYACDICVKTFSHSSTLAVHRRTHTGEKPFACDKCDKKFRCSKELTRHLRTHTGEKPFACDHCDKRFSDSSNLAVHRRTHTREKPFACDHCDKRFSDSSNLAVHRRTHTEEKRFVCDKCKKRYTKRQSLIKHLQSHMDNKK